MKFGLVLFLGLSLATTAHAQSSSDITQLFSFPCTAGSNSDKCPKGARPDVLLQDSDGNFYGGAGISNDGVSFPQGGTLFKLTPSGQFTLLFTFAQDKRGNYANGNMAVSGLVEGNDGLLYGATFLGGAHNHGVLFRISKTGTNFTHLHDFCTSTNCADGDGPGGLLLGQDGNIYGVNGGGGSNAGACANGGCGTIFRFDPSNSTFTTVHLLNGTTDGSGLFALVQASDGNFYGTNAAGHINSHVIRVSPPGQIKILFTFPEFEHVISGLVQGVSGNLYGQFSTYGQNQIQFFEISTSGTGFRAFPSIGQLAGTLGNPAPFVASDGNLWDTSFESSRYSAGSILIISPSDGAVLDTFPFDGPNGSHPVASVIQGADGKIYGTAELGGKVSHGFGDGTVWSLDAALAPPKPAVAAFSPTSGTAGAQVTIRGSNFIGTTEVTFNAHPASFNVLNPNFISATVPVAATTGPIAITSPGGTTTSQEVFTV